MNIAAINLKTRLQFLLQQAHNPLLLSHEVLLYAAQAYTLRAKSCIKHSKTTHVL
jgi:hypothetical protein